jgi:uncharacterized protein (TIGR00266 family)
MEIDVRHAPAFAAARCTLRPGERVRAEAGAMMATSAGVGVEAQMQGGLMRSLKRSMLGGESLFVTTYTAPPEGGWVDVAAHLPGDLVVRRVTPERPLNLSRGSYICSEGGVEIDTRWGGFRTLAGGEGGFLVHASGSGMVVVSCYGALDTIALGAGETVVLDSGHMVAYEDGVQMTARRVAGTMASLKSGEGLVFEFTGPGEVIAQSRNPSALITWLTEVLPFTRQ